MDERFINIGQAEDKVIEECAELIQSIVKIKRFGLFNHHPDRPESSNIEELVKEMVDVETSISNYRKELCDICPMTVALFPDRREK